MCQLITLMDQQEIVESCLFLIPISIQMTHIQLTSAGLASCAAFLLILVTMDSQNRKTSSPRPETSRNDLCRPSQATSPHVRVLNGVEKSLKQNLQLLAQTFGNKTFDLLILAKMLVSCITYTILVAGLTEKVRTLQQCWNILTLKS